MSIISNAVFLTDGYKTSHKDMYPKNTSMVYSSFIPRTNKRALNNADSVVSFGQRLAFTVIHEAYTNDFFRRPKKEVIDEIREEFSLYLNAPYDTTHFEQLHDLGYLPIEVRAIPEGESVPIGVPVLTIKNTHPDFFWITNYLETFISLLLWKAMTSATIAKEFAKLLKQAALKTDSKNYEFYKFQAHDFSMRGLDSVYASLAVGLGHAIFFDGSDNMSIIPGARKFYDAKGFLIGSVPATEHSVMSAGGKEDEIETFRRLLKTFPTGPLSVVSDTWDLWHVIEHILPQLKDEIKARDGKLIIRPDSGDPVQIICGEASTIDFLPSVSGSDQHWLFTEPEKQYFCTADFNYYYSKHNSQDGIDLEEIKDKSLVKVQNKGVVEALWDIFGGTLSAEGFKVLDPHIGVIYGDAISYKRCETILKRLEKKHFASTNMVFGVGSYTYQYNTRDNFGFAMKASAVTVDGQSKEIFKDPITDSGVKKSLKGFIGVYRNPEGTLFAKDQISYDMSITDTELRIIYKNGNFFHKDNFNTIRARAEI